MPNTLLSLRQHRLLAVERQGSRISSIVYVGLATLPSDWSSDIRSTGERAFARKISLDAQGKATVLWEFQFLARHFADNSYGRFDDRLILPAEAGGALCLRMLDGAPLWEVNYPSPIHNDLFRDEQHIYFIFKDQTWLKVHQTTGAIIESGQAKKEAQIAQITMHEKLTRDLNDTVIYNGTRLKIQSEEIHVLSEPARVERYPRRGKYPIEDWVPQGYIGNIEDKVIVWLENRLGREKRFAVGLLSSESLEPRRLLQIGSGPSMDPIQEIHELDGLLYIRAKLTNPDGNNLFSMEEYGFLIDPIQESFVGYFSDDKDSVFWHQNEVYWKGRI